jgi:hypothetical protein
LATTTGTTTTTTTVLKRKGLEEKTKRMEEWLGSVRLELESQVESASSSCVHVVIIIFLSLKPKGIRFLKKKGTLERTWQWV